MTVNTVQEAQAGCLNDLFLLGRSAITERGAEIATSAMAEQRRASTAQAAN
jgi:hypothetical protein